MKTAIFVEGQTELILVREMLLRLFEYQNIHLECYTLFADSRFQSAEYSVENDTAAYYFQIINVGNDNAVIKRLLNREKYLWSAGFDRIIGLRDMYSRDYRILSNDRNIDELLNQKFIQGSRQTIDEKAEQPDKIFFSFAIMEAEAWLLGMPVVFERINEDLTIENIAKSLNINLNEIDPENEFFQPATEIEAIFELAGRNYNKSKGDSYALVSRIEKEDYETLNESEKCASFSTFYQHLPNIERSEN